MLSTDSQEAVRPGSSTPLDVSNLLDFQNVLELGELQFTHIRTPWNEGVHFTSAK